jgi:hypothetical protein
MLAGCPVRLFDLDRSLRIRVPGDGERGDVQAAPVMVLGDLKCLALERWIFAGIRWSFSPPWLRSRRSLDVTAAE